MKNICPMMQFRATVHVDAMRAVNARYILTAAVIFLFLGASRAGAECVFLKNGALIVGSIVRETGSTLTIKSADGALRVIQRGHVLRIFYTDIYLGKLVVRLTDGSVMEAYMVDENADFYTFRDRLDNPAEFSIPRKKILFMARTNPTDLAGTAGGTYARMSWHPPYRPPRSYRIYVSEKHSGKVVQIRNPRGLSCRITGLKEKTWYRVIVTAVDGKGNESLPADAIELMTNTTPGPPTRPKLERLTMERGRSGAKITWDPAIDPDGEIARYRLYTRTGSGYRQIGETTGTEYIIGDLDPSVTHHFAIRALDNDGAESGAVFVNTRGVDFDITARGGYIIPLRALGSMVEPGYGANASFFILNFPVRGLAVGAGTGYAHFPGRGESVRNASMASLYLFGTYRFMLTDSLSIAPGITAGFSFIRLSYKRDKPWIQNLLVSSRKACEPLGMTSLAVYYKAGRRMVLEFGVDYGAIFERNHFYEFISLNAGLGLRI